MNLLIYLACQEKFCLDREIGVRSEWAGVVPSIGDLAAMGQDKRWEVVKRVRYRADHDVSLALVYVHPQFLDVPEASHWDSQSEVGETIHVEIEAIGKPVLQMGFNVLGQTPKLGERLLDYSPTAHPTLMQPKLTDWVIDRYDEFLPQSESPYKAVYLSWCKNSPLTVAA